MLKKSSRCVLASLNTCDVRQKVRLGISLAVALPEGFLNILRVG
jgi:hypothetical protein